MEQTKFLFTKFVRQTDTIYCPFIVFPWSIYFVSYAYKRRQFLFSFTVCVLKFYLGTFIKNIKLYRYSYHECSTLLKTLWGILNKYSTIKKYLKINWISVSRTIFSSTHINLKTVTSKLLSGSNLSRFWFYFSWQFAVTLLAQKAI